MSKIFFTSDTHFGHTNIIKYCNRPYSNTHEMNKSLIENWNNVVSDEDTIYHLGDIAFMPVEQIEWVLTSLKGKKHLIWGNHDRKLRKSFIIDKYFEATYELHEKTFQVGNKKVNLLMCHYPIADWHQYGNVIHIHGHSHGTYQVPDKAIHDVGVDVNNMTPISIESLITKINSKTLKEELKENYGKPIL